MNTALAKVELAPPSVTADQVELIKRTVAAGATPDELKLYFYDCERQGVHPLDKLLHFTKRGGKYTPITSIDLMRTRAGDTGLHCGTDDALFSGEAAKQGFAATVVVHRLVKGKPYPFTATARWEEYYPGEQSGHMWRKMPHTMLGKCAEALALRKAFPRQLAGLYAREEMDQAGPGHWGDSGSKEAAQAVAAEKLAKMEAAKEDIRKENPGARGLDLVGSRPPTAEEVKYGKSLQPLAEEALGKPKPDKATTKNFEFLKVMGELKRDIGEEAYYAQLKEFGVQHSNELTVREDQEKLYAALLKVRTAFKNRIINQGGGELFANNIMAFHEARELYHLGNMLEQPPDVVDKSVLVALSQTNMETGKQMTAADCIKAYKALLKEKGE